MYTKISQLKTAIAIFAALTTALPAPLDTNTKTSSCSTATVDSTCIDTYNTCMTTASGDNDAIAACALNLSTCTNTATKRDAENPEKRVATVCTNGVWGSVACVGAFGMCMKTADGAGEITSCALALSACEVGVNTK
ncbi:uncharacterized protein Bfra_004486 [Botrytis fragariae]|uniref:Uncharacterized protein n=1 Tax=Botrytis fragariae TaxID=1964551 RepID=A0A8H6AVQ7_9HELO|nr:uncharacterized protein Bfra_004486 [Botrytis fragariae]KAF5874476.1 hypothetical protein Bfra_004486 [Botrytis fragariae]